MLIATSMEPRSGARSTDSPELAVDHAGLHPVDDERQGVVLWHLDVGARPDEREALESGGRRGLHLAVKAVHRRVLELHDPVGSHDHLAGHVVKLPAEGRDLEGAARQRDRSLRAKAARDRVDRSSRAFASMRPSSCAKTEERKRLRRDLRAEVLGDER